MESEKVKEIKEALEHCGEKVTCQGCPEYNNEPVIDWFKCKKNLLQKTITLINELEIENERLQEEKNLYKEQFNELEPRFFDLRYDNEELKDRIADLEKGNEALSFAVKQGFNDCQTKTLKQFAERLKEHPTMKIYSLHNACERIPKAIDETLKEFIK